MKSLLINIKKVPQKNLIKNVRNIQEIRKMTVKFWSNNKRRIKIKKTKNVIKSMKKAILIKKKKSRNPLRNKFVKNLIKNDMIHLRRANLKILIKMNEWKNQNLQKNQNLKRRPSKNKTQRRVITILKG
jgi:hypothetical protein